LSTLSPVAGSVYDRRVRPSGWWYAAAAGIALGGILAGLGVAAKGVDNALEAVRSFDRTPVPGVVEVTIDDPGGYSIYQEFPGASDPGGNMGPPDVVVADPAGEPVDVDSYGTFVSYDQGSFEGRGIYTFRADQTGTYRIVATDAAGSAIAVGPGMGDVSAQAVAGMFGGVVGGVILAGAGIVTGIVVAITVGVARGRSRRRRRRVIQAPVPLAPPGTAIAPSPHSVGPAWSYGAPGWSPRAPGWSPTAAAPSSWAPGWSSPVARRPGGRPGTVTSPAPLGVPTAPTAPAVVLPPAASTPTGPGAPPAEPGTRVMAAAGAVAAAQPAAAGEPTLRGPAPTLVEPGTPEGSAPTEPLSRPGDPQSLRSPVDWSRSDVELPWDGERTD
jgi:hypothetical protein